MWAQLKGQGSCPVSTEAPRPDTADSTLPEDDSSAHRIVYAPSCLEDVHVIKNLSCWGPVQRTGLNPPCPRLTPRLSAGTASLPRPPGPVGAPSRLCACPCVRTSVYARLSACTASLPRPPGPVGAPSRLCACPCVRTSV